MAQSWQSVLERWRDAGLIDSATAERIHAYEQANGEPAQFSWPVRIAIGFGALMLGAGVLLVIAVHWDQMSPGARFTAWGRDRPTRSCSRRASRARRGAAPG